MDNFEFSLEQDIEFGIGCIEKLPETIKKSGAKKVLIISDRGLEKIGLVGKILDLLTTENIHVATYLDVMPNPTVKIVEEATSLCKKLNCDFLVALGGGSSIDVAKAVGVLLSNGGNIKEYEGFEKVSKRVINTIAIPTTAGTGSEVTASAVITDEEARYKYSIISHNLIPNFVLLDPELIQKLPSKIAAYTGVDALIHAMEAYLSLYATPFTDAMAEKALELIGKSLRNFVANRNNKEAACDMMLGSTFAGIAFRRAKLGNVHAMSHPVSAFYNVPHGMANAILLPYVLEYNALSDIGRYAKIYKYLNRTHFNKNEFKTELLINEIRKLNHDLDIPESLSSVGVKEEDINAMAIDAMKSGNVKANPRSTTLNEMIDLYKKAL